jgi:hypothetical protein
MAGDMITLEIPVAEEQIIIVEAPGIQETKEHILHIIANQEIHLGRRIMEAAPQTLIQVAVEVHHHHQVIAGQAAAVVLQVTALPDAKLITNHHLADLILLLAIIVAVAHILQGHHPVEALQVEEDPHLLLVLEAVEDVNLLSLTLYLNLYNN